MDVCKLPEAWAASGARLREIAATYPGDHPTHACLMNRIGELERCTKELEEALAAAGGLLSKSQGFGRGNNAHSFNACQVSDGAGVQRVRVY